MAKLAQSDDETIETLEDLIHDSEHAVRMSLHTAMPGHVVRYIDPIPGTAPAMAEIQPDFKATFVDSEGRETTKDYPIIPRAVVMFMNFGGVGISGDLLEGSEGTLFVQQRSIEFWRGQGGVIDPRYAHSHGLQDGFFLPGVRCGKNAFQVPTDGLEIATDSRNLVMGFRRQAGKLDVVAAGDIDLESQANAKVTAAVQAIIDSIDVRLGGAAATQFVVLADSLITAIDGAWAAATPNPVPDGGAQLKTTWIAAWATLKNSIKAVRTRAI